MISCLPKQDRKKKTKHMLKGRNNKIISFENLKKKNRTQLQFTKKPPNFLPRKMSNIIHSPNHCFKKNTIKKTTLP